MSIEDRDETSSQRSLLPALSAADSFAGESSADGGPWPLLGSSISACEEEQIRKGLAYH